MVGIAAEPGGDGYLLVTASGNVYNFGHAAWYGSPATSVLHLSSPMVGIATQQATTARREPTGYPVVCANGDGYICGDSRVRGVGVGQYGCWTGAAALAVGGEMAGVHA